MLSQKRPEQAAVAADVARIKTEEIAQQFIGQIEPCPAERQEQLVCGRESPLCAATDATLTVGALKPLLMKVRQQGLELSQEAIKLLNAQPAEAQEVLGTATKFVDAHHKAFSLS